MPIVPISGEIKSQPLNNNFSFLASGVIEESGSNSNGEYVRFADGTQICWYISDISQVTENAIGSLYRSNGENRSFPAQFLDVPNFIPNAIRISGVGTWGVHTGSVDQNGFTGLRLYSTHNTDEGKIGYAAIGRWK